MRRSFSWILGTALIALGAQATNAVGSECEAELVTLTNGQFFHTEPILQVGGFGEGDNQLAGADSIEGDNAGNIYVYDDVQGIIKVYPVGTTTGDVVDIISSADIEANGLAPLGDIEGIASGSVKAKKDNSELYLLDRDSDRDPQARILYRESINDSTWEELPFTNFAERPEDITLDRWGRIVVSERDGVVEVLDHAGTALDTSFGVNGTATLGIIEGIEADRLKAVDTDKHGNIYLADKDVGRIIKIDSDGNFVRTFGSQGENDDQFLEQVEGVGVDKKGLVYGRDESGDRFLVFKEDGTFIDSIGERGSDPNQQENADEFHIDKSRNQILIADNGNYRASAHSLKEECSDSSIFTVYDFPEFPIVIPSWVAGGVQGDAPGTEFDEPNELGFDNAGNLWAGDVFNLRVQVYDPTGTFLGVVGGSGSGPGQFVNAPTGKSGPEAIKVDSTGRMWVVDRGGDRVNVYNADRTVVGSFTSPDITFVDPTGMVIDSNDDIYIADQGTDLVHKFTFDGTQLNLVFTFQATDDGESILQKTETLAIDEARNLFYASSEDEGLAEVYELSTGNYLGDQVGEHQIGVVPQPGRFADDIEGMTADKANQYMFMSDERNGRFLVHDLSAADSGDLFDDGEDYAFLGAFGMQGNDLGEFLSADGVAVNAAGTLVAIADQGNYRIQVFTIVDIKAALGLLP